MPARARGIAVGVGAAGGPNPEVKLVVGGPKSRVIEGSLGDRGHLQSFQPAFRSTQERKSVLLIVTSGRQVGTAYRIAYKTI